MLVYPHIDPIAISIGPFFGVGPLRVHWYGIMYLVGFTAAWTARALPRPAPRIDVERTGYRRPDLLLRDRRHRRRPHRLVHLLRPRRDLGELAQRVPHLGRRHVVSRRIDRRGRRSVLFRTLERQACRRRLRFPGAAAGHRPDGGKARQFHQRRTMGKADGFAVGVRRPERAGCADRQASVPALRGGSRRPAAVRDHVDVHREAAAAIGAERPVHDRLRPGPLHRGVGAPAGCRYRLSCTAIG